MIPKNARANLAAALFWAAALIAKPEPPLSWSEREALRWDRAAAPPNLPEDGTAPRVVSECNCDQVRGLRVTVKGLRIGLDAAQAQAGRDRRTIERANSTIDQLVSDAGVDERDLAQELDGETWIPAGDVTQAMLNAWPVWHVTLRSDAEPPSLHTAVTIKAWTLGRQWDTTCKARPLRLPGMNKRGEVQARDMTSGHFERAAEWEYGIVGLTRWFKADDAVIASWSDGQFTYQWRPAIFAELDE